EGVNGTGGVGAVAAAVAVGDVPDGGGHKAMLDIEFGEAVFGLAAVKPVLRLALHADVDAVAGAAGREVVDGIGESFTPSVGDKGGETTGKAFFEAGVEGMENRDSGVLCILDVVVVTGRGQGGGGGTGEAAGS